MHDIKLTDQDRNDLLEYLDTYAKKISEKDINEIQKKLNKKIRHLRHNMKVPSFVPKMLDQINDLAFLLDNPAISTSGRNRIIAALHYFIWAEDRIPDYIPVVGFLDDAFVTSVVHREVKKYVTRPN